MFKPNFLSIKDRPQTVDRGLRTGYKTRTRYKMRTTDYVYKNSFTEKGKTERNGMRTSIEQ